MIAVNKKFEKQPSNHEEKSARKDDTEALRDDDLAAVTGGGGEGDTQLPDLEGGHTTYKKV